LLRRANAWIELEYRAILTRDARPESFCMTRVAERMYGVARKLSERRDMGCVWGPAGIGKSTIAAAIQAELPNTVVITVNDGAISRGGFARVLYRNLQRRRTEPQGMPFEAILRLLKQSVRVASRPLIIVDQAHRLRDNVLPLLCDLHDEGGASIMLVGTVDTHRRVTDDEDPEYGQFASRVGLRCDLAPELYGSRSTPHRKLFTVVDVRKIFQRGKVRLHPGAADLLSRTANESVGHLRRVERLLEWAVAVARKREKCGPEDAVTVIADDIHRASKVVEGPDQNKTLPAAPPARATAG
jgi:DNA transposition AAA+ family ATPase